MKDIKWHFLFWSAYFVFAYAIDSIIDPDTTLVKELIFFLSQNIFLFYALAFFLKKLSVKSKAAFFSSLGLLLLIVCSFISLRYFIRYYFLATFFQKEYGMMPFKRWFPTCFLWIVNCFFYSLGYIYLLSLIQKQKDLMKTKEEKMEEENIALRAQINPHFLYNTLDMLYAKALGKDKELADGILLLSDVMRYSIKPYGGSKFVNLAEEAEHLQNVIEINSLRFGHSMQIVFSSSGEVGDVKIVPLVLITLVENVFKYGELNNPSFPARIHLSVNGQMISFSTFNKKRTGPREISSGIGLQNALKRLDRAYGDNYSFKVIDLDYVFQTDLTINTAQ